MKRYQPLAVLFFCLIALPLAGAEQKEKQESDLWLESKLVTTYALNEHLNPFDIGVDVVDGKAIITGVVDNEAEKDLAEELAKGIEGIREVENNLLIKPGTEGKEERGQFMRMVSDATITARVKSRLLWNENTHGLNINVNTKNGYVTLDGSVDSEVEADLAEQIARNTKGVKRVESRLTVKSEAAPKQAREAGAKVNDAWITSKLESVISFDRGMEGSDVQVDTNNGVVLLTGHVVSYEQRGHLVDLAENIRGVKTVKADLKVGVGEKHKKHEAHEE